LKFWILLLLIIMFLCCNEGRKECTTFEMLNLSSGIDCFYCKELEVPVDDKYYRKCKDESGDRIMYVSAEDVEAFYMKYIDSFRNILHIRSEDESHFIERIGSFNEYYYEVMIDKKVDSVSAYLVPGYSFNSKKIMVGDSLTITFLMPVKRVVSNPSVVVNICDYDLRKFYARDDTVNIENYIGQYTFIPHLPGVYTFVGWFTYEESLVGFEFDTPETINRSFEVLPRLPADRSIAE